MRFVLAAVLALVLAPAALAAESPLAKPRLNEQAATAIFLANGKVRDWLERYPPKPTTDAEYKEAGRYWEVKVWSGKAGQIALGKVDDGTQAVTEAWTGPQVAWKMARGYDGAFGGRKINSYEVWLPLCAAFLLGLVDWRRLRNVRNLDLLVLLSFSVSLWFFNRGEVFWSVPLVYPPLVYLAARLAWIGGRRRRPRPPGSRPVWPVWVLAAATVFLAGFRIGLNVQASNVIDVGYAGVIGGERIVHGQSPYGNFPVEEDLKACGPADADGEVRERIQTNGRCESANPRGDTYGPVAYLAYVPGFSLFGWTGKWDDLPAAHFTSIVWDLLCIAGLALVGRRFGGARLAATLAFAWVAYPFTQYVSSSNTNDSILPAFLIWGFWLASSPPARGALLALASLTKFAPLILVPLWATYRGSRRAFALGFAVAAVAACSVFLLEPNVLDAARTFFDRTVRWQLGRESPFSIWDWRQYHAAGIPDLHIVQLALEVVLVVAAVAVAFLPRAKSPLQLAALSGALLVGFELVLTHWFYLYIPWFFPFAAVAFLATPTAPAVPPADVEEDFADRATRELVAAG
jgi:Glycosyltransferase family 87